MSIEFWVEFEPQIPPTRLAINFSFITARAERKDRLCVKLFDFFPRCIPLNLSRFVPIPVEVPTRNLMKKLFRENFSEVLCKPRLSSTETCEMLPYVRKFFPRLYSAEKIQTSTFIWFWLGFQPQIPPTSLTINFLFIIARAERKDLCV